MKVLLFIGNCPRHFHVARSLLSSGYLAGAIIEDRPEFIPDPPATLSGHLKDLFVRHFKARRDSEYEFFSNEGFGRPVPTLHVSQAKLNDAQSVFPFIQQIKADVAISYGVHKLSSETLNQLPSNRWNIHGGFSPWYRGVATLFWPSYFLEPQKTGMTLHELSDKLDAGPIVHQSLAPLIRGDGIHELSCRAVDLIAKELPQVLGKLKNAELSPPKKQKTGGKLWLSKDWRPEHLRVIYDFFDNQIVDHYLNGAFQSQDFDSFRQF